MNERERTELVSSAARSDRKASADIIRMVPQSARLYREAVRNLNSTLTEPVERQEARALIAELLSGTVKVRQESEAVYARLEMDAAVCSSPAEKRLKSMTSNVVAGAGFEPASPAYRM